MEDQPDNAGGTGRASGQAPVRARVRCKPTMFKLEELPTGAREADTRSLAPLLSPKQKTIQ